ncbi:MAG: zinc-ribbon domain-containing protein [Clostridia bacterium]|jgi:hypothetical protein|nr:zinc-ribbon domain-containing protein [Clostridia bacterium]
MKFCSHCGKEIVDEAIVCPHCGCSVVLNDVKGLEPDEISVGFCILSALIPLFGLIYWGVKHKDTPRKAKACGITALISWGVGLIISIASCASMLSILGMYF